MIIEKHTQQSDLTKPKGKTEIVYTIKPEDQVEDMKINNFINSQKIPKTTLAQFSNPYEKTQKTSSDIGPETLRSIIEKADKKNIETEGEALKKTIEDYLGCPLPGVGKLYLVGTPKGYPDICEQLIKEAHKKGADL